MTLIKRTHVMTGVLLAAGFSLLLATDVGAAISKDDVKKVQQTLKEKGYDPGPVDGVLGASTRAALRKFQKESDLRATGRLDEKTLDRLGMKIDSPAEHFAEGGKDMGRGGKELGKGAQRMGRAVKEGEVGEGAKELGKGAGRFGKKVGEGSAEIAKGVKDAVMPDKDGEKKPGSDDAIKQQVKDKLATDARLKGAGIKVDVKSGVVTLAGHLETAAERDQAVRLARSVAGVKSVEDKIHVGKH